MDNITTDDDYTSSSDGENEDLALYHYSKVRIVMYIIILCISYV